MASTYSTNLALELIGTGDQAGTWGNTTNTNLGTLVEQAISGYETQALTSGVTLTLTIPNGATGVARNMYLEFTGNGSTVIVPSNKKLYFVYNNCTSGTITMKVAGQTGVTIENGAKQILVSNGTDIVEAIDSGLEGFTGASNTGFGVDAGDSITTGSLNTLVGVNAGTAVTTGVSNTHVGYDAGGGIYNVSFTTYVGYQAGRNVQSNGNTAMGNSALQGVGTSATGTNNTAFGFWALREITSGSANAGFGDTAGTVVSTGSYNTLIGMNAGDSITSGSANSMVGFAAGGGITTGNNNSALGDTAYASGNYSNSTCLGYNSSVTGSNQVQLGNSSTTTYAYGAVQDRSDARDKTDIRDTQLGLNFILALRPRDFKWDMREDYRTAAPEKPNPLSYPNDAAYQVAFSQWETDYANWEEANKLANITHNGTHTRTRYHQGLIAQEVKQTMDAMGVDFGGYQDHSIKGGDAVLTIGYEELVAPLIKAIQELKAEFDEYKRTHP
jgi:hypothetical protein